MVTGSQSRLTSAFGDLYAHIGFRYYDAYLEYFHRVVFELGFPTTLQEYIFSRDANYPETGAPRRMVNRLLARSFNPMISLGYGLEFGIPGLVAEGRYNENDSP